MGESEAIEREPPADVLPEIDPRPRVPERGKEAHEPPHAHDQYSKGAGLRPAARMRQGGGTTASLLDWTARRPALLF
jgi:hypothetical protein